MKKSDSLFLAVFIFLLVTIGYLLFVHTRLVNETNEKQHRIDNQLITTIILSQQWFNKDLEQSTDVETQNYYFNESLANIKIAHALSEYSSYDRHLSTVFDSLEQLMSQNELKNKVSINRKQIYDLLVLLGQDPSNNEAINNLDNLLYEIRY